MTLSEKIEQAARDVVELKAIIQSCLRWNPRGEPIEAVALNEAYLERAYARLPKATDTLRGLCKKEALGRVS